MSIAEGCRVVLDVCMDLKEGEKVLILSDNETKKIGNELKKQAREKTPHTRFFNLDIYGNRPLNALPKTIEKEAEDADVTFWVARTVKGELESVRLPFLKAGVTGGRHAHMVNVTEEIVEKGLNVDYERIDEFTKKIHSLATKTEKIKIKSEKGTNLEAEVGRYKWVKSSGLAQGNGSWQNLPDGEIYTAPQKLEGTAVVDGTIGDYFDGMYTPSQIEQANLKLTIENKKRPTLVNIESENDELKNDILDYVNKNECASYVGELGIGTNIFLDEIIGNILIDEKYPTAHLAFGDPDSTMTFAGWSCPAHVDMVMKECDIWFDGKKIMEKGKFIVE